MQLLQQLTAYHSSMFLAAKRVVGLFTSRCRLWLSMVDARTNGRTGVAVMGYIRAAVELYSNGCIALEAAKQSWHRSAVSERARGRREATGSEMAVDEVMRGPM